MGDGLQNLHAGNIYGEGTLHASLAYPARAGGLEQHSCFVFLLVLPSFLGIQKLTLVRGGGG